MLLWAKRYTKKDLKMVLFNDETQVGLGTAKNITHVIGVS